MVVTPLLARGSVICRFSVSKSEKPTFTVTVGAR